MTFVKSDRQLARALGIDRGTLARWRKDARISGILPKPRPEGLCVEDWRLFCREEERRVGAKFFASPPPAPRKAAVPAQTHSEQSRRRQCLFDAFDQLENAHADGILSSDQYHRAGDVLIESIINAGRAIDAGIDEAGYRQRWEEIKAEGI